MVESLSHLEIGPASAQPILFIHGFPLSGEMWLATAEAIDEKLAGRFQSIIPDLPGFGRSPPRESVTIEGMADDLVALLDALGETRPVTVVGLSMGGAIALELIARHRGRVRALVLVDCRAEADAPEKIAERESLARAVLEGGSVVAADALAGAIFHAETPASLTDGWHARMAAAEPVGVAAASRALGGRRDHGGLLGDIDVPTLVVVGAGDRITPPDQMRRLAEAIAGATFVTIADAGHVPPIEQPEAFSAALASFLSGLDPVAA